MRYEYIRLSKESIMDVTNANLIIFDRKMSIDELRLIIPKYRLIYDDLDVYFSDCFNCPNDMEYVDIPRLEEDKTILVMPLTVITSEDIEWHREIKPARFAILTQDFNIGLYEYEVYEVDEEKQVNRVFLYVSEMDENRYEEEGDFLGDKHFGPEEIYEPRTLISEKLLGFDCIYQVDPDIECDHYDLKRKRYY